MYVSEQTFLTFVRKRCSYGVILDTFCVVLVAAIGFVYISTPITFYMGHMSFFDMLFNGNRFYRQPPQLSVHGLLIHISINARVKFKTNHVMRACEHNTWGWFENKAIAWEWSHECSFAKCDVSPRCVQSCSINYFFDCSVVRPLAS